MTLCNAEIIKKIKDLDEQKQQILTEEAAGCCSDYQRESDLIDLGYDFDKTRVAVTELNSKIEKFKHILNVANATVIVPEFEVTIGECLVRMAQLNCEKRVLEQMSAKPAKTRKTTYGGAVEFTVTNYDIDACKNRLSQTNDTIRALQIAIDRINLTHTSEV